MGMRIAGPQLGTETAKLNPTICLKNPHWEEWYMLGLPELQRKYSQKQLALFTGQRRNVSPMVWNKATGHLDVESVV